MTKPNRGMLGAGIVLGAVVGAAWVATRARQYSESTPRLIDWAKVTDLALSLNKEKPLPITWKQEASEKYREMVRQAEPLVSQYTGSTLPNGLDSIYVFDRRDWILTNVNNFEFMFQPIERIHERQQKRKTAGTALMGAANQLVLSSEMGLLIGFLAKRVLGQYDLSILGKEALSTGKLYFVEPNLAAVQNELGLPPTEFRLWIALHETTHAHEFEAHPWLRDHFNSILTKYFESLDDDLQILSRGREGLKTLAGRALEGLSDRGHWVEIVMTREQREVFRHMQALMCVVEGYSNHVMNAVGCNLLPTYDVIRQRIESRQAQRSTAEKLFIRLTGLDIKFEQYRLGERFVEHVVQKKGMDFMNQVWEGPENIPTLDEIDRPDEWIKRMSTGYVRLDA